MVFVGRDNMSASRLLFDLELGFVKTCFRYNGSLGAECKYGDSFIRQCILGLNDPSGQLFKMLPYIFLLSKRETAG